jgi:hypothetical protein
VITSNLKLVRESVTKATKSIDEGARNARDEMMMVLIQLSKEEIQGRRPKGEKATAGQPPMNRTGNLRRSIRGEKITKGFAKYEAIVGPTIIYGRAVELGGNFAPRSWKGTTAMRGFPYMAPAFKKFQVLAPNIVRKNLVIGGR